MKRKVGIKQLCILCVVALHSLGLFPSSSSASAICSVEYDPVVIRESRKVDSKSVWSAKKDELLIILSEIPPSWRIGEYGPEEEWFKVKSKSMNAEGWVKGTQVSLISTDQAHAPQADKSHSAQKGKIRKQLKFVKDKYGLPRQYVVVLPSVYVYDSSGQDRQKIDSLEMLATCYLIEEVGLLQHIGYNRGGMLKSGYVHSEGLKECESNLVLLRKEQEGKHNPLEVQKYDPYYGQSKWLKMERSELEKLAQSVRDREFFPIFSKQHEWYETLFLKEEAPLVPKGRLIVYIAGSGEMLSYLSKHSIAEGVKRLTQEYPMIDMKFYGVDLARRKPKFTRSYDSFDGFLTENNEGWIGKLGERTPFALIPEFPRPSQRAEQGMGDELYAMVILNELRELNLTKEMLNLKKRMQKNKVRLYPLTMKRGYPSESYLEGIATETLGHIYYYDHTRGEPDNLNEFVSILRGLLIDIRSKRKRNESSLIKPAQSVLIKKDNKWFEAAILVTKGRWSDFTKQLSMFAEFSGIKLSLPEQPMKVYLYRSGFFDDDVYAITIGESRQLFQR